MINIYRFGRYVNAVKTQNELKEWLIKNVPYQLNEERTIPYSKKLEEVIEIAKNEHYTFKTKIG